MEDCTNCNFKFVYGSTSLFGIPNLDILMLSSNARQGKCSCLDNIPKKIPAEIRNKGEFALIFANLIVPGRCFSKKTVWSKKPTSFSEFALKTSHFFCFTATFRYMKCCFRPF